MGRVRGRVSAKSLRNVFSLVLLRSTIRSSEQDITLTRESVASHELTPDQHQENGMLLAVLAETGSTQF